MPANPTSSSRRSPDARRRPPSRPPPARPGPASGGPSDRTPTPPPLQCRCPPQRCPGPGSPTTTRARLVVERVQACMGQATAARSRILYRAVTDGAPCSKRAPAVPPTRQGRRRALTRCRYSQRMGVCRARGQLRGDSSQQPWCWSCFTTCRRKRRRCSKRRTGQADLVVSSPAAWPDVPARTAVVRFALS